MERRGASEEWPRAAYRRDKCAGRGDGSQRRFVSCSTPLYADRSSFPKVVAQDAIMAVEVGTEPVAQDGAIGLPTIPPTPSGSTIPDHRR